MGLSLSKLLEKGQWLNLLEKNIQEITDKLTKHTTNIQKLRDNNIKLTMHIKFLKDENKDLKARMSAIEEKLYQLNSEINTKERIIFNNDQLMAENNCVNRDKKQITSGVNELIDKNK